MEWISVKDKMPITKTKSINSNEKYTVVMVYHAGGHDIAKFYSIRGFRINGIIDGTDISVELHDMKVSTITHWMPLPEPPKE